MTTEDLLNTLGYSIRSEKHSSLMNKLDMNMHPESHLDYSGNQHWVKSCNKKNDIILTFDGYRRYADKFGEPMSILDKQDDELILVEIDIDSEYEKTRALTSIKLPFDLALLEEKEILCKKIGKSPTEKSSTSYGYAWWFHFEEYRMLSALNHNYQLIWIRIMKLTADEKEKNRLVKFLVQQNKNIKPENSLLIAERSKVLPTKYWQERMNDGDDQFTNTGINDVKALLENYIQTLLALLPKKKATPIYNSVKKLVNSINKINTKNNGFIETMEREELCEFINELIKATGLQLDKTIDLTEQWREW